MSSGAELVLRELGREPGLCDLIGEHPRAITAHLLRRSMPVAGRHSCRPQPLRSHRHSSGCSVLRGLLYFISCAVLERREYGLDHDVHAATSPPARARTSVPPPPFLTTAVAAWRPHLAEQTRPELRQDLRREARPCSAGARIRDRGLIETPPLMFEHRPGVSGNVQQRRTSLLQKASRSGSRSLMGQSWCGLLDLATT